MSSTGSEPASSASYPKAALTVDEFRSAFGNMSRSTFYEQVAAGNIQIRKLGRRTLVPASEVQVFLDRLPSLKAA